MIKLVKEIVGQERNIVVGIIKDVYKLAHIIQDITQNKDFNIQNKQRQKQHQQSIFDNIFSQRNILQSHQQELKIELFSQSSNNSENSKSRSRSRDNANNVKKINPQRQRYYDIFGTSSESETEKPKIQSYLRNDSQSRQSKYRNETPSQYQYCKFLYNKHNPERRIISSSNGIFENNEQAFSEPVLNNSVFLEQPWTEWIEDKKEVKKSTERNKQ